MRGAPAIGITATYGVVLAARQRYAESKRDWRNLIEKDLASLSAARPTAVNLFWALDKMRCAIKQHEGQNPEQSLLREAKRIHAEDVAANKSMGQLGAELIDDTTSVITHCNAGALATGGYGTALGVIRNAWEKGKIKKVYADETRPWMQGSRLTAWELVHSGIPVTLIVEGAAASRMALNDIGWIIVGADRIAANGDVANKIGTYGLAVSARHHGVKVMVVAPTSTIDMTTATGADISIESRDPREILKCGSLQVDAAGVNAWNPVFDVTPARLVDAIVTEKGVIHAPDDQKLAELMLHQG